MASSGESSAPDGGGEVKPSPAKPGKVCMSNSSIIVVIGNSFGI